MGAQALVKEHPEAGDTIQTRIEWLGQVRLFSDIKDNPTAMEHVARLMEYKRFTHGTAVIKEGEEGQDAYFLISGTVKVIKRIGGGESFPVAMLEAKHHPFFGEAALL